MIRHKKTAKIWLRVVALMLALLMLGSSTVLAADLDDVPYYSYTYWEGPSRYVAVPMRTMYEATHQIDTDSLGLFEKRLNEEFGFDSEEKLSLSLSHATLSPDMKELYMLDSGNSRIFVVDTDTMELKRVIRTVPLIGEEYGVAAKRTIKLEANTEYQLSFFTRRNGDLGSGDNVFSLSLWSGEERVSATDVGGSMMSYPLEAPVDGVYYFNHEFDVNNPWTAHTLTFNTGDATDIRFQFAAESAEVGGYYVDAMSLKKVENGETVGDELMSNRHFDKGLDGWEASLGAVVGAEERYPQKLDEFNNDAGNDDLKCMKLANALSYNKAEGVYVGTAKDENGNDTLEIIISDTESNRILILDQDGLLKRIIERPSSEEHPEIPKELIFKPVRVIKDNKGYMYVVSKSCYYGLLVYDDQYNFKGFHGAYKASSTVLENLKGWITGLFMTNKKAETSKKNYSTDILDVAIDGEGMLYTLSDPENNLGQIKRLGLSGSQTLNFKSGFTTQSGENLNFVEQPQQYWPKGESFVINTNLNSLAVDSRGFIYAVDSNRGRVFVYDEECRMLCGFSLSKAGAGDQVGTFYTACAVAVSDDKLFVVDSGNGNVTVFELTEYGKLYKEADYLTINGEYDKAMPLWEQVLDLDANNQRAYEGLAKAHLAKGNYDKAMYYAELGQDQQTYSLAFAEVQKEWLSNNFWWLFIVCIVLVGGIAAMLVVSKKRKLFTIKNDNLRTALTVSIRPFQAFQDMKSKKFVSVGLAFVFVIVFYLAKVSQDLYGGFMYVIVDKANYNALITLIGSVGILLLWVITNWGVCMLNDGKGSLKEVFAMSAYSMAPMILYSVIFTVGSHIIPASSTNSFGIIGSILTIYMVLLLLIGMTVIHEYSFFKAIGMAVLTVLCMALAAFVICSVVLLSQQFIVFIASIFNEARLR